MVEWRNQTVVSLIIKATINQKLQITHTDCSKQSYFGRRESGVAESSLFSVPMWNKPLMVFSHPSAEEKHNSESDHRVLVNAWSHMHLRWLLCLFSVKVYISSCVFITLTAFSCEVTNLHRNITVNITNGHECVQQELLGQILLYWPWTKSTTTCCSRVFPSLSQKVQM